jgi:cell division protein FtsB
MNSPFSSASDSYRPTRPRKRPWRAVLIWTASLLALIPILYVFILGEYGWVNMWRLSEKKGQMKEEVTRLEAQNFDLSTDLDMLKGDPKKDPRLRFKLERNAREKHGLVRPGDLVYKYPADTLRTETRDP